MAPKVLVMDSAKGIVIPGSKLDSVRLDEAALVAFEYRARSSDHGFNIDPLVIAKVQSGILYVFSAVYTAGYSFSIDVSATEARRPFGNTISDSPQKLTLEVGRSISFTDPDCGCVYETGKVAELIELTGEEERMPSTRVALDRLLRRLNGEASMALDEFRAQGPHEDAMREGGCSGAPIFS